MRCNVHKLVRLRHRVVCEKPSVAFLVSVIKACGCLRDLEIGKLAHKTAAQSGLASDVFVANSLITMYSKCHSLIEARRTFERIPVHTTASWNSLISAYAENGEPGLALELFFRMLENSCPPDSRTFVAAAGACASLAERLDATEFDGELLKTQSLELGRVIHTQATNHSCSDNIFVANSFVDMFGKCGSLNEASRVFDKMVERDVISWTAMMLALVENGKSEMALELFSSMECAPNSRTYVAALKACSSLASRAGADKPRFLRIGRDLHSQVAERGFEKDLYVGSSLLDMYGSCGCLREAQLVFDKMPRRDIVAWNSFLLACVENGESELALEKFKHLQERGECPPDSLTFVAALMACSSSASKQKLGKCRWLGIGLELHSQVSEAGLGNELSVANTLVDMYSKCGDVARAYEVFQALPHRSLVSWNALIQGLVEANEFHKALELFSRMVCSPNASVKIYTTDRRKILRCLSFSAAESRAAMLSNPASEMLLRFISRCFKLPMNGEIASASSSPSLCG